MKYLTFILPYLIVLSFYKYKNGKVLIDNILPLDVGK